MSLKRFYFALFDDGLTLKTLKLAYISFCIQSLQNINLCADDIDQDVTAVIVILCSSQSPSVLWRRSHVPLEKPIYNTYHIRRTFQFISICQLPCRLQMFGQLWYRCTFVNMQIKVMSKTCFSLSLSLQRQAQILDFTNAQCWDWLIFIWHLFTWSR